MVVIKRQALSDLAPAVGGVACIMGPGDGGNEGGQEEGGKERGECFAERGWCHCQNGTERRFREELSESKEGVIRSSRLERCN